MAGHGGRRPGSGRKPGPQGPRKATIERAAIAERVMAEASMAGKKLGKETLQEFMELFTGLAAAHQPTDTRPETLAAWRAGNEPFFEKYAKLACAAAEKLAQYQSPKLAAVQVVAPAPDTGPVRKRFSVGIFDGQGRPAPRHIEVKPTSSVTSTARN